MANENMNLCEECAKTFNNDVSEIVIIKGLSFGLHKCSICGKMVPVQEYKLKESA